MSLKHVKALVETAKAAAQHHPSLQAEALAIIAKAEAEIAALEKAATAIVRNDFDAQNALETNDAQAWCEAADILKAIAKEAG